MNDVLKKEVVSALRDAACNAYDKAQELAENEEGVYTEDDVENVRQEARNFNRLAEKIENLPKEIIRLVYTEEDALEYAHDADDEISDELALERAHDWGKSIQDTAATLIASQLCEAVVTGDV